MTPEGGIPCYKTIIDQRETLRLRLAMATAALDKGLNCMGNSMMANLATTQPTEAQRDDFVKQVGITCDEVAAAFEPLLKLAAEIEAHVSGGGS
jgi:hypothetical protein